MIRVVICDDQHVVREGLRAILSTSTSIEVVGIAGDAAEALDLVAREQPDVVLMDLNMPIVSGIQATRQIRERFPAVRVLALTTYDADEWVIDAVRAGAAGYLLKDTPRAALLRAIEGTAAGQTFIDPNVAGKVLAQVMRQPMPTTTTVGSDLSQREREVLRLVARGLSNAEIGAQLFLSEGTVRNYVTTIIAKLGATDRTHAAVIALRHGLAD